MRYYLIFFFGISLMLSCGEQAEQPAAPQESDMESSAPDMVPDSGEPAWRVVLFDASGSQLTEQVLASGKVGELGSGSAPTHVTVMLEREQWRGPAQFSLAEGALDARATTPQLVTAIHKIYRGEECSGPVYLPRPLTIHMVWEDEQAQRALLWRTAGGLPYQGPRSYFAPMQGGGVECQPYPSDVQLYAADPAPESWSYLPGTPPFTLYQTREPS